MKSTRTPAALRWEYADPKPTLEEQMAQVAAIARGNPTRQPPPRRAAQAARDAFKRALESDSGSGGESIGVPVAQKSRSKIPLTGIIVIPDGSTTEEETDDEWDSAAKRSKGDVEDAVDRQVRLGRILHKIGEYNTRAGLWRKPVIKLDSVVGVIAGRIPVSSGEEAMLVGGRIPARFAYSREFPMFA